MLGRYGLWNRFPRAPHLPWSFSLSLFCFSSNAQPPLYFSWSSQRVGYPVPGLVSTLFHHMYSVPLRSVQIFLQEMLHVWQPMHLSRWKTMETCALTSICLSLSFDGYPGSVAFRVVPLTAITTPAFPSYEPR